MLRNFIVSSLNGQTVIAVIEDGQTMELIICNDEASIGSIYKGTVTTKKANIRACFVDIGLNKEVFLHEANGLDFHKLNVGDEIIVQTVKGSHHFKSAQVTMKLSLVGNYLIYSPFTNYVAASKKLSQIEREKWLRFAEENQDDDEGIIFRTAVKKASYEEVKRELIQLRVDMNRIIENGKYAKPQTLLYAGMDCIEQTLNQYASSGIAVIETDNHHVYTHLQELASMNVYLEQTQVKHVNDFVINIEKEIELAMKKVVWMQDGSYLLIEENESLTVIDVNSGKSTSPVQEINEQAAKEAIRQLRLRNIGGMIVIDFIRTRRKEERSLIPKVIEKAVKDDVYTMTVFGFTSMGLFELTRKKQRRSLRESIKLEDN